MMKSVVFTLASLVLSGVLAQGSILAQETRTLNVKQDFSAKGDGAANDTKELQAALDKANTAPSQVEVAVPAGVYRITQPLRIGSHTTLRGDGPGATTIVMEGDASVSLISRFRKKPLAQWPSLKGGLTKGSRTIAALKGAGSGDHIQIASNASFTENWEVHHPIRSYYKEGEILKIEKVVAATGNHDARLYLAEDVAFSISEQHITSVEKHATVTNITVEGIGFDRTELGTHTSSIRLIWVDGAVLRNLRTRNTAWSGIVIDRSRSIQIEDVEHECGAVPKADLKTLYGTAIINGSKHVTIRGLSAEGCRHGVSGGVGGADITVPMYVLADGVRTTNSRSHSLDTHAATAYFTYTNATVDHGFSVSGYGHRVINVHSLGGPFLVYEGGENLLFENIVFDNASRFYTNEYVVDSSFRNLRLNLIAGADSTMRQRCKGQCVFDGVK